MGDSSLEEQSDTTGEWYTERMAKQGVKSAVLRKAHSIVYKQHIKRLVRGRVLDVGCGIGANLRYLDNGSVGVDHNVHSVELAVQADLDAQTPDAFHGQSDKYAGTFDTILCAHVMEHMDRESGVKLLEEYLPYLRANARVVLITPQETGYATDPTHVRLVDFEAGRDLLEAAGLKVKTTFSFPLPRRFGPKLSANEFIAVGELRAANR